MSRTTETLKRGKVWWLSAASGVLFGSLFRIAMTVKTPLLQSNDSNSAALLISVTFLAVVPFAMGYISVRQYLSKSDAEHIRWWSWVFLPWVTVLVEMLSFAVIGWEGTICLVIASPIMLVFSIVGGVAARIVWHNLQRRSPGNLSVIALPLILIAFESYIPAPYEIRTVNTDILIHAPANIIWSNIKSVRAIARQELPGSWVGAIGFPRPIAATLSHDGIGGVRQASFTGGLVFTETVNQWEPDKDLRFSIRANTDSIPPTTLDEHVKIGGAFFDVLDGEYSLEPRPDGVLLHLRSHERLSTHLNPYAEQWTDAVMRSIQSEILAVIKRRCEAT